MTSGTRTCSDPDLALWPALTRFYGISPRELARIPRAWMRVYAEAMVPLSAGEQLLALEASVYPHLRKGDAAGIVRRRERELRRYAAPRARIPTSPDELTSAARAAGIVVEGVVMDA